MLYVLWGHPFWARLKLRELKERAEKSKASLFYLKSGDTEPIANYISGGLFGRKVCLIGEFLTESPDYSSELKNISEALSFSDGIFFLLEGDLNEEWRERFKKSGAKMQEFKNPTDQKFILWAEKEAEKLGVKIEKQNLKSLIEECSFDPWALTRRLERISLEGSAFAAARDKKEPNYFNFSDLAGARNKEGALRLLLAYIRDGLGAEEAFWKLSWKIKTLRMIDSGASDLGLHPFVMQKARADLQRYSSEELKKISISLMDIFSEVRRGEESFETGVEKILLKL